jgi:hypothetical protein
MFDIVAGERFYLVGDISDMLLLAELFDLILLGFDEVEHQLILCGVGLEQCGHSFIMRYSRLNLLYNMVQLLIFHRGCLRLLFLGLQRYNNFLIYANGRKSDPLRGR